MAKGNPEIYKLARPFTASDSWDEPLAKKPSMVRLPVSAAEYLDSKADRAAWLRSVIMGAIVAEQGGDPIPSSPPTAPTASHRYSKAELEAMDANNICILMKSLKGAGLNIKLQRASKAQMIDRILEAQQN